MIIRKIPRCWRCCPKKKTISQKPMSTNQQKAAPNQKDLVALQYRNAVEFGKFSFELEEKRGQSLITHSGHMLTAFSLYSTALLTLLAALLSDGFISRTHLFVASTSIAIPLVISLIFTMLAQWRFKYQAPVNAKVFAEAFSKDPKNYCEQYQFDFQFVVQLQQIQDSKKRKNDKRLFHVRMATLFFFISIIALVLSYVYLSVLYTKGS